MLCSGVIASGSHDAIAHEQGVGAVARSVEINTGVEQERIHKKPEARAHGVVTILAACTRRQGLYILCCPRSPQGEGLD